MAKIKRTRLAVLIAALITMAIVGTPLNGYAAGEPGCSATVSPDLMIHIPVVRYGDALYSLDLQILGASGNLVEFSIANMQTTSQDCAVQSTITSGSSLMLNLASLILGSDNYDFGLQYVSSQEINSSKVSAKNTSYKFEIKKVSKNSDVWKGWSYCKTDIAKTFPEVYVTAFLIARGRNVTFALNPDGLTGLGGENEYQVREGELDYYGDTETIHIGGQYATIVVGTAEATMDSSSGTMFIGNTNFSGSGVMKEEMSVEFETTLYFPDPPYSLTYTQNVPVHAEWLDIPQNVFQRTNDYELTGKLIDYKYGIERTCTWRFIYYP